MNNTTTTIKSAIAFGLLSSSLLAVSMPTLAADTGSCVIRRDAPNAPPMSWDNGDYVSRTKYSIYNSESCNVPANTYITNLRLAYNVLRNPQILNRGLPWGTYSVTVNGNGMSGDVREIVSASYVNTIGTSGNLPAFKNAKLDGLGLNLYAGVRNTSNIRCRESNRAICEDYMYIEYTLAADYITVAPGASTAVTGDFNGDNIGDTARYFPSTGEWWVFTGGSNGTITKWAAFGSKTGWQSHLVGDFNGDGMDDIANFHPSNGTWWVTTSTGSSFSTSRWDDFATNSGWSNQYVGDFNGDGFDDISNYHAASNGTWISYSSGSNFSTQKQ